MCTRTPWSRSACDRGLLRAAGTPGRRRRSDSSTGGSAGAIERTGLQMTTPEVPAPRTAAHSETVWTLIDGAVGWFAAVAAVELGIFRSEEHTSELQSLMRNSYAVFCLKKKKNNQ